MREGWDPNSHLPKGGRMGGILLWGETRRMDADTPAVHLNPRRRCGERVSARGFRCAR